jgi:TRAP-type C4-dicarboxylate transport system permease small subunit
MPKSPARKTANAPEAKRRRLNAFTTATVVSFSLTLLAGSIAVLTNTIPLRFLSFGDRVDLGAMLFVAPVLALVLAVIFETTRIALKREPLPEPRQRQVVRNWAPGRREG